MTTHHDLKIWPDYFDHVANGDMPFQIRKNDRNYQTGDTVMMQEVRPHVGEFTGREVSAEITYVLRPGDRHPAAEGLQLGWCAFGLKMIMSNDGRRRL